MSVSEGEKEKVKMKKTLQIIAGVLAVSSMFWFALTLIFWSAQSFDVTQNWRCRTTMSPEIYIKHFPDEVDYLGQPYRADPFTLREMITRQWLYVKQLKI